MPRHATLAMDRITPYCRRMLTQRIHPMADMPDEQWRVSFELFQKPAAGNVIGVFYVIYDHPSDMPKHYVVRRWEMRRGCGLMQFDCEAYGYKELWQARTIIPTWAVKCIRTPNPDDPKVLETWL